MVDAAAWLVEIATIASSLVAIGALAAIVDRLVQGRLRRVLQQYLTITETHETAKENGEKLDALHEDHMQTMGAQVAIARNVQELTDLLCEELEVPEHRCPEDLTVGELERYAAERGARWPGEFTRGGSE